MFGTTVETGGRVVCVHICVFLFLWITDFFVGLLLIFHLLEMPFINL